MPHIWSRLKSMFHRGPSPEAIATLTPPPALTGSEELTDGELEAVAGGLPPLSLASVRTVSIRPISTRLFSIIDRFIVPRPGRRGPLPGPIIEPPF